MTRTRNIEIVLKLQALHDTNVELYEHINANEGLITNLVAQNQLLSDRMDTLFANVIDLNAKYDLLRNHVSESDQRTLNFMIPLVDYLSKMTPNE